MAATAATASAISLATAFEMIEPAAVVFSEHTKILYIKISEWWKYKYIKKIEQMEGKCGG